MWAASQLTSGSPAEPCSPGGQEQEMGKQARSERPAEGPALGAGRRSREGPGAELLVLSQIIPRRQQLTVLPMH